MDQDLTFPTYQPLIITEHSEYVPLPTGDEIVVAQRAAEKRIKGFTDEEIRQLRIRCKWDLGWLAYGVLGYDKLSPTLHGEICEWIKQTMYEQYTLMLIPRSHYKSTLDTISETTQCALPDDTGNAKYPYDLGPNVRQCIIHDVADMAQKFLRSITQHFTVNPLLMGLFPECVPDPRRNKINIRELELPRTAYWNESTFDTMGVGARAQGNHYNRLKLDDIYGEQARDSESERRAHIQWFDNVQSFLLTPAHDQLRIRGTRWAFDDVYAHAMEVYGEELKTFIRSVYKRDDKGKFLKAPNGERIPIFPEQFTVKSLKILEKNKKVWNAQYINDPREGSTAFQPEWKRYYTLRGRKLVVHESATPFNSSTVEEIDIEELDIVILVDPALEGDDPTGIVVTGMDRKERVFILYCMKEHLKPEELCTKIFQLVYRYSPRIVAIEEVLFSALYQPWFNTEMKVRGVRFKVEGIKTRQQEKFVRVSALTAWYSANLIHFKQIPEEPVTEEDKYHAELEHEYDQFGATDDYHMHDGLAMGCRDTKLGIRVWKRGGGLRSNVKAQVNSLNNKDLNTGYSKIRG